MMIDPMLKQIEGLEEVDGMLGKVEPHIGDNWSLLKHREARQLLQETIARMRQQHEQSEQAKQAAIELLRCWRDDTERILEHQTLNTIIALLDGSAEKPLALASFFEGPPVDITDGVDPADYIERLRGGTCLDGSAEEEPDERR